VRPRPLACVVAVADSKDDRVAAAAMAMFRCGMVSVAIVAPPEDAMSPIPLRGLGG
jgi:hypothetical protein